MSVGELYVLSGVNINPVSTVLNGIADLQYEDGAEEIVLGADGSVDPTFVSVFQQTPRFRFTTFNLAAALAQVGISGLGIAATPGLDLWFAQVDDLGTRLGASSHLKCAMVSGLMYPTELIAPHGGEARLSYEVVPQYDGSNNPFTFTANQSLPTIAALTTVWTCGPVVINGTQLAGVEEIRVDFGITLFTRAGDGDVWPTFVAIRTRQPRIRVRCSKISALTSFGLTGVAQGATDSLIYFRAKADAGANVPDGTASHVKLAIDDGKIACRAVSGSGDEAASGEYEIVPKADSAGNPIIAVSTGVAIT